MSVSIDCCRVMWTVDCPDYDECPGPPPVFHLPPPPRPPFLHELPDCSIDINTCNAIPVIDAEYHSSPAFSSLAVFVVCSLLLLGMLLIATALVCKHKKRMRNLLPCKSSPQTRCELSHSNGVIYEDLTNIRPRSLPQSSIEMVDVKGHGLVDVGYARTNYPVLSHSPVFICPPPARIPIHQYNSQDLYNPVYEELSNGSGGREESEAETESTHHCQGSEDEFAEDELSLCGLPVPSVIDAGFESGRYIGHNHSFPVHRGGSGGNNGINLQERRRNCERKPRSLERPRCRNKLGKQNFVKSSHYYTNRGIIGSNLINYKNGGGQHVSSPRNLDVDERLLLDALVRFYPHSENHLPYLTGSYTRLNRQQVNLSAHGQDSDSGYSHNTDRQNMNTMHNGTQGLHKCSHSTSIILS